MQCPVCESDSPRKVKDRYTCPTCGRSYQVDADGATAHLLPDAAPAE